MKIKGIEFSRDEVEAFQKQFMGSLGANVIAKLTQRVHELASDRLVNTSTGLEGLKIAQGMVLAIRELDELAIAVGSADLEKGDEIDGEDENNTEEVVDVRY